MSNATTSRALVEALVLHHLNPILQGRQRALERLERFQAAGDPEATTHETAVLLFLEQAYSDGLKLLHRAMELGQGRELAQ